MPLISGTKLGPYEIVAPLGAGGMGEVYRARDTRLGREVAIKILPQHRASTAEVRQRFEREAKAVSSLNHPHICTLHDVGHQDGTDFLVMEYLEGESLAKRLERGLLPTTELLRIAIEIADALEKAHRQGVIHRDLKPGNIMLTKAGAKLLDFGLAKAAMAPTVVDLSTSPTVSQRVGESPSTPLTAQGTIVGTFQYMAPEQLEGREADARSDIFSFGAVLYEMATGNRAFSGKSQASVIGAILHTEPPPISSLQPMSPPQLDRVVKTCLAKDPEDRFQTAHDLKLQLEWIRDAGSQAGVPAPVVAHRKNRERIAWAAAGLLLILAALFATGYFLRTPAVLQLETYLLPPENTSFTLGTDDAAGPVVLSKDGQRVAFVAKDSQGNTHLYVRALDDKDARMIVGTEGAVYPFWSPNGESLGFFANGKLRRVAVVGGTPLDICDARRPRGGSWGADDSILFAPDITSGLFRVSASPGSTPVQVTQVSAAQDTNRWPELLPDGKHFIYLASNHAEPLASAQNGIYYASLDGKENRFVMPAESNALYVHDELLWVEDNTLLAIPFDAATGRISGKPAVVAAEVGFNISTWRAAFDASDNGLLVYQPGAKTSSGLLVIGRDGKPQRALNEGGTVDAVRFSPDGNKLAIQERVGTPGYNIWILDLERGTRMRLTFGLLNEGMAWSADGREIYYSRFIPPRTSGSPAAFQVVREAVDGTGRETAVLEANDRTYVSDVSRDGQNLLFERSEEKQNLPYTAWITSLAPGAKAQPLLDEPVGIYHAGFSPDGKWVLYVVEETGRYELYAMSLSHGARQQLTNTGALFWRWRADGKGIYYTTEDGSVYDLPVSENDRGLSAGTPQLLFKAGISVTTTFFGNGWDASPDGQRFILASGTQGNGSLAVVETNWPAKLKKQ